MSREIKFRAWTGKRMILPAIAFDNSAQPFLVAPEIAMPEIHLEWMQSTGLKDKNGVDIYEGDIIELPNTDVCVIEWRDTGFIAIAPKTKWEQTMGRYNYWSAEKILGNIYQNPELLKQ